MNRILTAILAALISAQAFGQYKELPLGSIKADGWLLEQLQRQANGLTGHLDEIYSEVMGPSNAWTSLTMPH